MSGTRFGVLIDLALRRVGSSDPRSRAELPGGQVDRSPDDRIASAPSTTVRVLLRCQPLQPERSAVRAWRCVARSNRPVERTSTRKRGFVGCRPRAEYGPQSPAGRLSAGSAAHRGIAKSGDALSRSHRVIGVWQRARGPRRCTVGLRTSSGREALPRDIVARPGIRSGELDRSVEDRLEHRRRQPAREHVLLRSGGTSRGACTARRAPPRGARTAAAARRRVPQLRERPQRRVPAELRRARRPPAPTRAAPARGPGTARRRRARRASACWPAARSGRPPRCRCRSGSGRRRRAGSTADPPARPRCSAAHRKSPDASPVNTRPVRLPPCAAGASPSSRIRASGSPNPGSGRPQYGLVAEPRDLLDARRARATRPAAGSAGTRRSPPDSAAQRAARSRPLYLSSSLSSRRDVTASPTRPMTDRYATWTSRTGLIAPTVSERMRSTPW